MAAAFIKKLFSHNTPTPTPAPSFPFDPLPVSSLIPSAAPVAAASLSEALQQFSFVTYNVWFSPLHRAQRTSALLSLLCSLSSDVVCLQEVTAPLLAALANDGQINQLYYTSCANTSRSIRDTGYGVVMLVRRSPRLLVREFRDYIMESKMGRTLIVAIIDYIGEGNVKGTIIAGSVHLESLNAPNLRRNQLKLCGEIFSSLGSLAAPPGPLFGVLGGDFNFDSTRNYMQLADNEPLENTANMAALGPSWFDVWPSLVNSASQPHWPADALRGLTFDTEKNAMLQGHRNEQMRYDRIVASGTALLPHSIEILGSSSIGPSPDGAPVFISDHFGLKAIFQVNKGATASEAATNGSSKM